MLCPFLSREPENRQSRQESTSPSPGAGGKCFLLGRPARSGHCLGRRCTSWVTPGARNCPHPSKELGDTTLSVVDTWFAANMAMWHRLLMPLNPQAGRLGENRLPVLVCQDHPAVPPDTCAEESRVKGGMAQTGQDGQAASGAGRWGIRNSFLTQGALKRTGSEPATRLLSSSPSGPCLAVRFYLGATACPPAKLLAWAGGFIQGRSGAPYSPHDHLNPSPDSLQSQSF